MARLSTRTCKHLHFFNLNSVLTLVGKPWVPLHNANCSSRLLNQVRTLLSDARWRSSLKSPTYLGSHKFPVSIRNFHGSQTLARNDEEKKPETLQELVETSEKQETAVTVGQKGRYDLVQCSI